MPSSQLKQGGMRRTKIRSARQPPSSQMVCTQIPIPSDFWECGTWESCVPGNCVVDGLVNSLRYVSALDARDQNSPFPVKYLENHSVATYPEHAESGELAIQCLPSNSRVG